MPSAKALKFFGLNVIRAFSIIAMLLLFASSLVTLVNDIKAVNAFVKAGKESSLSSNSTDSPFDCSDGECDYVEGSTVPNQPAGAFWAVVNRLLIIFQVVILIASECSWPANLFDKYFPVLGSNFGLGALGIIQALLGAAVLSHHVDEFSLVSAFFVFAISCFNMLFGLIFRQEAKSLRSIRAWRDDRKDVLPNPATVAGTRPVVVPTFTGSTEKTLLGASRNPSTASSRSGMGFGRQGQKAAEAKGYFVQPPEEALPTYVPKPKAESRSSSPEP